MGIQPRIERRTHSPRLHPNAGTVNPLCPTPEPATKAGHHPHIPPAATAQLSAARRACRSTTRPTVATSTPLRNTGRRNIQGRRGHQAGNHSTRSAAALPSVFKPVGPDLTVITQCRLLLQSLRVLVDADTPVVDREWAAMAARIRGLRG